MAGIRTEKFTEALKESTSDKLKELTATSDPFKNFFISVFAKPGIFHIDYTAVDRVAEQVHAELEGYITHTLAQIDSTKENTGDAIKLMAWVNLQKNVEQLQRYTHFLFHVSQFISQSKELFAPPVKEFLEDKEVAALRKLSTPSDDHLRAMIYSGEFLPFFENTYQLLARQLNLMFFAAKTVTERTLATAPVITVEMEMANCVEFIHEVNLLMLKLVQNGVQLPGELMTMIGAAATAAAYFPMPDLKARQLQLILLNGDGTRLVRQMCESIDAYNKLSIALQEKMQLAATMDVRDMAAASVKQEASAESAPAKHSSRLFKRKRAEFEASPAPSTHSMQLRSLTRRQ